MAMDFPNNPTLGQVFGSYVWNGTAWAGIGSANNLGVQVADLQAGTKKIVPYASVAARTSAVPTPTESMISYLADSNVVQAYDGSAWNSLAYASAVVTPGLVQVAPASVTLSGGSATISSTGRVTTTGSSTYVSLNTVFNSTYDHYRIIFNLTGTSTATEFQAKLRNNTTDESSALYNYFFFNISSATPSGSYSTTDTKFQIARSNGSTGNRIVLDITAPMLAQYTNYSSTGADGVFANSGTGALRTTTAYNGITFLTGGATTINGCTIDIYGYSK